MVCDGAHEPIMQLDPLLRSLPYLQDGWPPQEVEVDEGASLSAWHSTSVGSSERLFGVVIVNIR